MNEHVTDYLNYYFNLQHSPEFAVLLRGEWGSGKSFYIKNFMASRGSEKFIYISLYGVSSAKEITDQIFEQLHPVLASKGMKITGKIIKGILKGALKIDLSKDGKSELDLESNFKDFKLPDFLGTANSRVIVFDDLERCTMDIPSILGYINQFVESNGNKVIIIANEKEIISAEEKIAKNKICTAKGKYENKTFEADFERVHNDNTKYIKIKEKLIGKSFEIESDLEAALNNFILELINNEFIDLLKNNKDLIKNLYAAADYNNLRHLKQAILDLERFYLLLPAITFKRNDLVIDLISTFLSMSFELKKGKYKEEDIKELFFDNEFFATDDKDSLFQTLKKKYSITRTSLNFNLWFEFFSKGTLLSKNELELSIRNSSYFFDENTPAYIKLWRWNELNDDEFYLLYKNVYDYFIGKQIVDQNLLLHIISMLLFYSQIGLIRLKKATIISIAKKNIANLKVKKQLKFQEREEVAAFGSLGFHGVDITEFQEIKKYLRQEAQDFLFSTYPIIGKELFALMKNSPEEFKQKITLNNTSETKYYNIPIFKHIPVQSFFKAFLSLSNTEKRLIGYALKERYDRLEIAEELVEELGWLTNLREMVIIEKNKRSKKPSGFVLESIVNNYLTPSIENLEMVNSMSRPRLTDTP